MKKLILLLVFTYFSCMVADQKSPKKIDVIQKIEKSKVDAIDRQFELYSTSIEMNISEMKLKLYFQKQIKI